MVALRSLPELAAAISSNLAAAKIRHAVSVLPVDDPRHAELADWIGRYVRRRE